MKRAVILHSKDTSPEFGWFPWLKSQLEVQGYEVWVPQLPNASTPNAKDYTEFLLASGWDFSDNLIIGHSAGAVEILHLLQNLPSDVQVRATVMVSAFKKKTSEKPGWPQELAGLFEEPFDYAKIKTKAQTMLFIHGDDDPWCDPRQAHDLAKELSAEYVLVPGGQHFSFNIDPRYTKFPKLIEILDERHYL